jgi:DNA-binding transcriptional ArsR family regulator
MEADRMARSGAKGKATDREQEGAPAKRAGKRTRRRSRKGLVDYETMKALSKEERVEIFAILCERVASPKEISDELDEGLSQVSYHVKVLRESRLIALDRKVPRRGAVEHYYRAVEPTLIPAGTWDRMPMSIRRCLSASILKEFFEDAAASIEAGTFEEKPGELCWIPLILDSFGTEELEELTRRFLGSVLELQASANKRLLKGKKGVLEATSATVFLSSFLSARSPKEGKKASAAKRR